MDESILYPPLVCNNELDKRQQSYEQLVQGGILTVGDGFCTSVNWKTDCRDICYLLLYNITLDFAN